MKNFIALITLLLILELLCVEVSSENTDTNSVVECMKQRKIDELDLTNKDVLNCMISLVGPKRNSKMSPSDVLALASLLDGTERGRFYEPDLLESAGYPPYVQFAGPIADDAEREEWINSWADGPVEYLPPYALEPVPPRYEIFRDGPAGRYPNRGFPAKRFMVSKKRLRLPTEEGNPHKYF